MAIPVNGIGDATTVKAMQAFFKVAQDGVISGQNASQKKYRPALTAVQNGKGGSKTVTALQKWCGLSNPDGIWGANTSGGLQRKLKALGYLSASESIDNICGTKTMKAFQQCLNNNGKAKPSTLGDKVLKECYNQAVWMKNAKYGKYSPVTLAHSKTYGTCVTYEGCVYQRLGVMKSGEYIWHDGKGYGTGKVTHANSKMNVMYQNNAKLSSLKGKIQKGDCLMFDDNKSGEAGNGGHVCFATGSWSGNDAYIWDFEPNRTCAKTQKPRTYSGSRKVLAIIRLKG